MAIRRPASLLFALILAAPALSTALPAAAVTAIRARVPVLQTTP